MRIQNWSSRALFSAGFLLLSSSLAQASPPNHEFFQCNEPSGILCAEQRNIAIDTGLRGRGTLRHRAGNCQ